MKISKAVDNDRNEFKNLTFLNQIEVNTLKIFIYY